MLNNIFLFQGKNFHNLDQLDIYSYPEEIIKKNSNTDNIRKIIYGHDHGYLIQQNRTRNSTPNNHYNPNNNYNLNNNFKKNQYIIDTPVPQVIDDLNIYTTCINRKIIIGLIFEKDDNPYDYKDIFEELLNELLVTENTCSFEEEIEIENLLITIFIDIRRYGDEYVEKRPEIEFHYDESFTKAFLFGIDDVGKSSLVRKIKTGKFSDNYFIPTKKFNIDYVQKEDVLLSIWDMPGYRGFRQKWLIGLQDSNIVIYMIDVSNQLRFQESKNEFWKIINRYELKDVPVLILANKTDLLNSSGEADTNHRIKTELVDFFEFEKIKNRDYKLIFTSIKTNYNIDVVIDSIFNMI